MKIRIPAVAAFVVVLLLALPACETPRLRVQAVGDSDSRWVGVGLVFGGTNNLETQDAEWRLGQDCSDSGGRNAGGSGGSCHSCGDRK